MRCLPAFAGAGYDVRYANYDSLCEIMMNTSPGVNAATQRKIRAHKAGKRSDSYVESFARGLSVIRAFGPQSRRMTLTQVADRARLTRAAARRILLTLQTLGYVGVDERRFFLTPRILDLGYSYLSSMPLANFAQPIMEDLVAKVEQSSSAAVLDGNDVVYVLRVPKHSILTGTGISIGARLPAYVSSMGRVLLAALPDEELKRYLANVRFHSYTRSTVHDRRELAKELERCRKQGYALVLDELEEGLCAIAVPIVDAHGRTIAAMNVSRNSGKGAKQDLVTRVLPELKRAATRISSALALHPAT